MKKFYISLLCLVCFAVSNTSYAQDKKSVVFKEAHEEEFENFEDYKPVKKEVVKPLAKPDIKLLRKNAKSNSVKIVALVNGEMISSEDVDNRINAFIMTTQIPLNSQTEPMIFQRVLHNAIDEKLKIQDAKKNGIVISKKEIDNAMQQFAESNSIPPAQLSTLLKKANVGEEVFRTQMEADLAWVRLVRKKMAGDIDITQKEIEATVAETRKDLSLPKYLVSEIFIKKENAKNLEGLVSNLREDPRFELYAAQFSQSPSSALGGRLGWVNKGTMLPQLEEALAKMKDGQVSNAINVNGDYYILKLERSFNPEKDEAPEPNEEEVKKFLEAQRLETFANRYIQQLRQNAIIELRN